MEQVLTVGREHERPGIGVRKTEFEGGLRDPASGAPGVLLPVRLVALLLRLDVHVVIAALVLRLVARVDRLDADEA